MCCRSRTTCLLVANVIALLLTLILLLYSSLLLHLMLRTYGVYEKWLEPPGYASPDQPEVYMHPPPGPLQAHMAWPAHELSWFDRVRLWFGDDDLNNYQGQNVFNQPRAKRSAFIPRLTGLGSYDPAAPNSPNIDSWSGKGVGSSEWPDTAPLPHPHYWMNGVWRNSSFVLSFLLTLFAVIVVLVHMFHIASVGLAQSHEPSAPGTLRTAGILSLFIAFASACIALYASLGRSSAISAQQRQLILAYRWYDRNDLRRSPTHFVDELQVALNCCGADRPAELVSPSFGFGPSLAAQLPRSCCARDRDELIALRAPLFEPPLAGQPAMSAGYGAPAVGRGRHVIMFPSSPVTSAALGQCDLRQLPDSNNQGCVPVVRRMMITLFNWLLLYGIALLSLHLYLAFASWALAIDRSQTRTSAF
jgi:hypothetical protein